MKSLIYAVPLLAGFLIDSIVGDPYTLPHPVRLIGNLISFLEKKIRLRFDGHLKKGGVLLAFTVLLLSFTVPFALLAVLYRINTAAGIAAESIMCFYLFAAKCLKDESMKVCRAIEAGDTEGARKAVSMIVGRDTAVLDEKGIIRAAVETVAENSSDGVTAPLLFTGLGGAPLGFLYKAANTMDSMIGYKNEKYADIGFFAAKLDDVFNYIPSRLTALVMCLAAPLCGLDGKNAFRIWRRDRRNHASPNSAQTESACAGALGVRLAGDAWYFGELHKKKYIGDNDREIEYEDIRRVNRLMYAASAAVLVLSLLLRTSVLLLILP